MTRGNSYPPASTGLRAALAPVTWLQGVALSVHVRHSFFAGACLIALLTGQVLAQAPEVRVKDIARIGSVRGNQLYGYGLVVGLAGTGDSTAAAFTVQSVVNMLARLGIVVPAAQLRIKNVAAVMTTAEMPAFVREGDRIDVTLSSLGDAKSLVGGVLLQTPLQAADAKIYAVAQGPVAVGGAGESAGGSSTTINHLTVGRVPGGAIVERVIPTAIGHNDVLTIVLRQPDFTTAARVAEAVRTALKDVEVEAVDAARVNVKVPDGFAGNLVGLMAQIESVTLRPDVAARVVINERTGTIIIGGTVRILPVAIAHGNLKIEVQATPQVSQPAPLGQGQTTTVTQTQIKVKPQQGALIPLPGTDSVQDLVKALNALGVTPRDLISILQALRAAGALQGELVIQ
ncbi:MAG: flagellar basal body P-ring protein FlgI [Armatimonadetes bacterium]|nr:flagellar basal body P-ring protein FlgI [Armatimonadota bacterium]